MKRPPSTPAHLDDEAILTLLFARDESALVETERKYRALLDRVARSILPDPRDREECLNDTLLAAWEAIPPARPASLRAYLVQIMRRTAIDRAYENSAARRVPAAATVPMDDLADLLSGGEAPDEGVQAEAVGRLISDFLRGQSARRRAIFLERFYLREPVPAIAKALGLSESAVYKELTRTRVALKQYLAENGVYV